jgi:hypothetical protein
MSNNRGPWATSAAQAAADQSNPVTDGKIGTLPPGADATPSASDSIKKAFANILFGLGLRARKSGDVFSGQTLVNYGGGIQSAAVSFAVVNGNYAIRFTPFATGGAYNQITQAGDSLLHFSGPTENSGALTIAPWSNISGGSGIRITGAGALQLKGASLTYNGSASIGLIGGLTPVANGVPYYAGTGAASTFQTSPWGRSFANSADAASAKSALSLSAVATSGAYADLSGKPTSLPASDVYSWAKQPTKPAYSFSDIAGEASASQITTVNTAGQHDNDTSPASTEYVLMHSAAFRGVVQTNNDENISVNFQSHGGNLLKSVSKGVFFSMPLGGGTGNGQYRPGDAVVISADRDFAFIIDFSAAGGAVQSSGGTLLKSIIAPGGNGVFYYFVANENSSWKMMHGAKSMAQTIDFPGGVAGEEQSPYYAFKLPDLHSSSHSTRIELSGAGCRSTASGYFGRSGAHIDATITASYRPGDCIEFVVGSNSTGATGSSTLALLPLSSYTITAPGGGSGNAAAPTYSSGLAPFLAAVSTRPTSTASNAALDAGSQGGPMGGPGQKPDLRNGFGGGGAVFDGAGSGQYGAGAGVARLHYSSPYSRPKVIFALGCNAANGSTTFVNFSPSGATVSAIGSIRHSSTFTHASANSIHLNNGYLSISPASLSGFRGYSYVHIAMRWRYVGGTGNTALFDSRTGTGSSDGFAVYYNPPAGVIYIIERERTICSYVIDGASLINKFNLVEVEIVPGVSRAYFRLWLNGAIVSSGFSEDIGAIASTDRFTVGCSNDGGGGGSTSSDYILGPCIMVRL